MTVLEDLGSGIFHPVGLGAWLQRHFGMGGGLFGAVQSTFIHRHYRALKGASYQQYIGWFTASVVHGD